MFHGIILIGGGYLDEKIGYGEFSGGEDRKILDFEFCEALQCVARNLYFEYDYFDSTAGDFGLADAVRWAADFDDFYDFL